jgi:arylsulfate sulfotransferase
VKQWTPLHPILVFSIFAFSLSTVACGGAKFNDPPGIAATAIAPTQNPLVAQLTITAALGCPGQLMVEFGPDTSYGRSTAWYPTTAISQTTAILVAGMRPSTAYHMRAQAQAQCANGVNTFTGPDLTFQTGPLPPLSFPTLAVTRPNPSPTSPENPGIELVDVIGDGAPPFFTDRDANPIWYYDVGQGNYAETFKLMPNGHIVMSIERPTLPSLLREIDLAGNVIREMDVNALATKLQTAGFDFTPAIYHHDFIPMTNGHLIVLTNSPQTFNDVPGYGTIAVVGDNIIDLDQNWNPVWAWNTFDHLDEIPVTRHLNGLPDWTHSNALVYSPVDGNLILSMRHQSWILKIDYNNGAGAGDIRWRLGYQGDFALTQGGAPSDDPSLWFSFQHFPSMISQTESETTLAIWDNGDFRPLDPDGDLCSPFIGTGIQCYSRATIFQVDEGAKVANLLWDNPPGDFSNWGGSINQLSNGNVEYDINALTPPQVPGTASEVQEVTQTSPAQVVWKLDFTPATATAYRAYRVPSLYPGVNWPY